MPGKIFSWLRRNFVSGRRICRILNLALVVLLVVGPKPMVGLEPGAERWVEPFGILFFPRHYSDI